MLLTALLNLGFVTLFYKELKLTTFDPALAAALGLRPAAMNTALMVLVSITAVAAFDAVGSVLVVAFFIIPPATAWLLSDRLAHILLLAPPGGILATLTGYEFSRGNFLGIAQVSDLLVTLDDLVGPGRLHRMEHLHLGRNRADDVFLLPARLGVFAPPGPALHPAAAPRAPATLRRPAAAGPRLQPSGDGRGRR